MKAYQGGFICGIVGYAPQEVLPAQFGSVYYVYITRKGLFDLCSYLMDSGNLLVMGNGFDTGDASLELQKSLIEPINYIKSCLWVPYQVQASIVPSTLSLNGWDIPNIEYISWSAITLTSTKTSTLALEKHPMASQRGNFLNVAPYANHWFNCAPYGL